MNERAERPIEDHELRELAHTIKQTYALPIPFGAVDAALWQFLTEIYQFRGITFQRRSITNGSVLYRLLLREQRKEEIGGLQAQMINEVVTVLSIVPGPLIQRSEISDKDILIGLLIHVLERFVPWCAELHNRAVEEAESFAPEPINTAPPTALGLTEARHEPRPSGRHSEGYNEWARREIASGRSRDEILPEYLQRANIDPSDKEAIKAAREQLRKALSRTKWTK